MAVLSTRWRLQTSQHRRRRQRASWGVVALCNSFVPMGTRTAVIVCAYRRTATMYPASPMSPAVSFECESDVVALCNGHVPEVARIDELPGVNGVVWGRRRSTKMGRLSHLFHAPRALLNGVYNTHQELRGGSSANGSVEMGSVVSVMSQPAQQRPVRPMRWLAAMSCAGE